ncbi:hypothetical protein LPY66_07570 [Dehalobacter sp. DCM]|uniref:hypothetical protein n=1 Tax=Dehalobacter sp. DCM TaxID=2907827 RepID=UPI003081A1D9|nr:hypothetical protein LPY66_07570 [Dehalobacter sp. DCM]
MSLRFHLKPEAVTWLGSAFDEKSIISPLYSVQAPGFAEQDKQGLMDQGIIDTAGALTPTAYEFFNGLAGAQSFAGFRVAGPFGKIDKVAYFNGDRVYWVDNAGETLIVSDIKDTETILTILNEITGISHLVNASLDIELDPAAAQVFTALTDLTRQAALVACAGKGMIPEGFSLDEILSALNYEETRWFGSYLRRLRPDGVSVNPEIAAIALQALIDAGYISKNETGYSLVREAYAMAVNMLIIENVFHLRIGKVDNNEIQSGEALFLQAGLHDALMIDSDGKKIGFTSVSTNAMIEYLISMMTTPPKI